VKAVTGSAEVILNQVDGDQRYRIARTSSGYLITARSRDMMGAMVLAEWLHKTEEAARACVDVATATSAAFRGIQRGVPTAGLLAAMEQAVARHNEVCDRIGDKPLVGEDVRRLREQAMPE